MEFPFLGITTKIRKKCSSNTESKLHWFFSSIHSFDAFLKDFTASLLNGFLTVLVEEWLHRCAVMTQSTPGNFLPRKITLNLKLHFSLTTSLHFTWLDCNMLLRYRTQLFELWRSTVSQTRPVETDTAKYIFLVSANDFFGEIATHGGNTPSAHHNKLVNFSYFVVKHTTAPVFRL